MKTIRIIFLLAMLIISSQLHAQEDKIASMATGLLREHYNGSMDERYLSSKETNSSFKIQIYLPLTYSDTQEKYPIMVLTDAIWSMGIAQSTFDYMTVLEKEIPEVIIVGIDYPYSKNLNWARNRFRDMLPTHVEDYSLNSYLCEMLSDRTIMVN